MDTFTIFSRLLVSRNCRTTSAQIIAERSRANRQQTRVEAFQDICSPDTKRRRTRKHGSSMSRESVRGQVCVWVLWVQIVSSGEAPPRRRARSLELRSSLACISDVVLKKTCVYWMENWCCKNFLSDSTSSAKSFPFWGKACVENAST